MPVRSVLSVAVAALALAAGGCSSHDSSTAQVRPAQMPRQSQCDQLLRAVEIEMPTAMGSRIADALAAQVAPRMTEIAGCDLTTGGTTCATDFVTRFGLRAYRRPLQAAEVTDYVTLYTEELARSDASGAFAQVVSTFLQSPFFLYHADVGASGTVSRLRCGSQNLPGPGGNVMLPPSPRMSRPVPSLPAAVFT